MEKKFKICLLTSVHRAYDTRIFYREAATLSEAGYRVTLVAQHNKNEIINNIKIIALPKFRNRFHRIVIGNWFIFIVSIKEKAILYHFHDPELMPTGLLLKAVGRKVIFDIHEKYDKIILARDYTAPFLRKILSVLYKIFIMHFLNYFDYVIPAYDEIKNLLAKFVDADKIQTVTNYPKVTHFRGTREKDKKKFVILYVGALTKIRGITEIVTSMKYMPSNCELWLLGRFSPEDYFEEIKKTDGFGKVKYFGFVEFCKVSHYCSHADMGIVCIQPIEAHIDTVPNKLFEYMLAGLPVIASNFPLWREIVEDNCCGICVDPMNPKDIANAIKYLYSKPKLRKKMGINGRKIVLEKYNWGRESKKLISIYRKILKSY